MSTVHSHAGFDQERFYPAAVFGVPKAVSARVPLSDLRFPTRPIATTAQPPRSACARTAAPWNGAGMQKHSSRSQKIPRNYGLCDLEGCPGASESSSHQQAAATSKTHPATHRPASETTLWSSRGRNHIARLSMKVSRGFKQLLLAAPTGSPLSRRTRSKERPRQWHAASNLWPALRLHHLCR
jgi:hypothetical protein